MKKLYILIAALPFFSLAQAQHVVTISDSVNVTDALILDDQGIGFDLECQDDFSGNSRSNDTSFGNGGSLRRSVT